MRLPALVLLIVATVLAGCRRDPPPFRIGLIGVMQGPAARSSGIPARDGARLAVDSLNRAGGVVIGGRRHRVELIEQVVDLRPDAAAAAATALINLDSVDVIVGPQQSALAIAAGAVAERAQVPLVSPMASGAEVTRDRRMIARLAFVDAFQGAALATFVYDSLGLRRVGALHNAASGYGRDIVARFRETFVARGGEMAAVETYDVDAPSHEPQLRRLLAARPEAILLPNFTVSDSAQMRRLREGGFDGRFIGSDAWDAIALARRRDAMGSIIVANWDRDPARPGVATFLAAWQRVHRDRPRATAASTWDAVHLLARAAAACGSRTGAPVMDALRHIGAWDGAFVRLEFAGSGDPIRPAIVLEVREDSTHRVAVIGPAPR